MVGCLEIDSDILALPRIGSLEERLASEDCLIGKDNFLVFLDSIFQSIPGFLSHVLPLLVFCSWRILYLLDLLELDAMSTVEAMQVLSSDLRLRELSVEYDGAF